MTSDGGSADPVAFLPLKPAVFQILLSLAEQERHGYAIIQEVERRTGGQVVILAGALYRFLGRMLEDDLIEESEERPAPESDDSRRRYYRITDFGRAVAVAEADRLERLLRDARVARLHPETAACLVSNRSPPQRRSEKEAPMRKATPLLTVLVSTWAARLSAARDRAWSNFLERYNTYLVNTARLLSRDYAPDAARAKRRTVRCLAIAFALFGCGGQPDPAGPDPAGPDPVSSLTHAPMVAAITDSSAKVWFRVFPEAAVQVEHATLTGGDSPSRSASITTSAATDYTGTVVLTGLVANTEYAYRIFVDGVDQTADTRPTFKTFPSAASSATIAVLTDRFDFETSQPPALDAIAADAPDFVLVLGDWDHRDVETLTEMRAMHREMRVADPLLYTFPVAHVWDDWDYASNNSDKTFTNKSDAIRAYDEYWPGYDRPLPEEGIWHKFSYGGLVEVFMLDLRSQRDPDTYKDPRFVPDDQPGANRLFLRQAPDRSMLDGNELGQSGQKAWLKDALVSSTATWKIIASSVTWNPRTVKDDSWWDFLAEQDELVAFIEDNEITGIVVVSGDIHSGGGIDDGTSARLPEMTLPTANVGFGPTCNLNSPLEVEPDCGTWSEGFRTFGAGYGLITLESTSARLEVKDQEGRTLFVLSLNPN